MNEPRDVCEHALRVGHRYFGNGGDHVASLNLPETNGAPAFGLIDVTLPGWAGDLGVGHPPSLLVDPCCVVQGEGPAFERCDWLRAAHLHISGWLERSVEDRFGPIHSYAFRLSGNWSRAYEYAWVNRIYLFLRRLAARQLGRDETELFGSVPEAKFFLSHDVDALAKTTQMRIKSTVMSGIAIVRHLLGGRFKSATSRLKRAIEYAGTGSDYWLFDEVCAAESDRGFRSIFMFADRTANSGPVAWLIDPSYRATDERVAALIRKLHAGGWQLGIHPGFKTWNHPGRIGRTREEVTTALGAPITLCRQHWLRFSWKDTWAAQEEAGVKLDFTLGFNDRSGFRNGAAVQHRPWNREAGCPHGLKSVPTVIMDSHLYDYAFPGEPAAAIAPWIDEVIAVGGEASLLWHIHTMHDEFGWGPGYIALLDLLAERGATVAEASVDE